MAAEPSHPVPDPPMLLAVDVGGTKSMLGVYTRERGPRDPLVTGTLQSADFASLEELCRHFLATHDLDVDRGSMGVPGPVVNGCVRVTNLPWEVDAARLGAALGLDEVVLFNDLVGITYSVPALEPGDLHPLVEGTADPLGTVAVLAPGTGLGQAFATRVGGVFAAHPSEGSHVDFGPLGPLQERLLTFLAKRYPHVSYERVASGMAVPDLFEFLRTDSDERPPSWLTGALAAAEDPTPVIVAGALGDGGDSCPVCRRTVDLFLEVLAAQAGNFALSTFASGGVYLAGGILPRILDLVDADAFAGTFRSKGRLSGFVERVPVHVVLDPAAPLLGAAWRGLAGA